MPRLGEARRVHCNMQGRSGATEAGRRAPTLPRVVVSARAPVRRCASLAAQALTQLWSPRHYNFNTGFACGFVKCLWTVLLYYFNAEDAQDTTWTCVVDMSLSAPAQAARGTRTSSLDQLDFQERRQLIASSLSLTDFLHVGAKEVAAVAGQSPSHFVSHAQPHS